MSVCDSAFLYSHERDKVKVEEVNLIAEERKWQVEKNKQVEESKEENTVTFLGVLDGAEEEEDKAGSTRKQEAAGGTEETYRQEADEEEEEEEPRDRREAGEGGGKREETERSTKQEGLAE